MKKLFTYVFILIGVLVLAAGSFAGYVKYKGIPTYEAKNPELKVEGTPEQIEQGRKLASLLCVECHAASDTRQLTGAQVADLPEEFGTIRSRNITQHPTMGIGSWTDGQIAYLLRTGVKPTGEYIPPYMPKFPKMSDDDIKSIIAYLRSDNYAVQAAAVEPAPSEPSFLVKMLSNTAFKPLPYPEKPIATPAITDQVAYGKYLVDDQLGCFACHSADFKTNNDLDPTKSEGYLGGGNPMLNKKRQVVNTANITMDTETGIGNWTEAEFVKAVKEGRRPDGHALRYPMFPYSNLQDEEIKAIYAYLKTVPALKNEVARNWDNKTAAN